MITKKPFLNVVVGLLLVAALITMWLPCYEANGDSTSLMGYISFPTEHKGVTKMFEAQYNGFILGKQVWVPLILVVSGVSSIILLLLRRNLTDSLILPAAFSTVGILNCWLNPLCRMGGLMTTLYPTVLMAGILILCIVNGDWLSSESEWKKDPSAVSKFKSIQNAIGKKNIELLKSYAQSHDPSIRIAALDAIAQVGGNAAFHPIVAQLSSTNEEVRIAAANALGKLGDIRGRTYLMHFIEADPSSRVRAAMQTALGQLSSLSSEH